MDKKVLGIPVDGKSLIMGIQHVFAMMGATILVPILCNISISVSLISAGIGTILFHFIAKQKVPVFLGSSFAFLGALMSNIPSAGQAIAGSTEWQMAMGKVSIAIMIAGIIYMGFSLITKVIGVDKIKKLFPPIVVGPVIIIIGLNLAPTALGSVLGANSIWQNWLVLLATAITIVTLSIFAKGFLKVIPILIGILVGYILAMIVGIVEFKSIGDAGWVIFQKTEISKTIFGFAKYMTFDWKVIMAISPIAIVTFMEHLGDINANGAVVGKNFFADPGVHRTLLGDGIATFTAGLIGGPCNTTYGENTAVLALTKNYNPKLLLLSGCMALILGIFTKFGAILGTVPAAVLGGASLILFGMIASAGLRTMVDAKINFSDTKNMLVVSIILVVGIGMQGINIKGIAISPLAIATVVGVILNLILPSQKSSFIAPTASAGSDVSDSENKTK